MQAIERWSDTAAFLVSGRWRRKNDFIGSEGGEVTRETEKERERKKERKREMGGGRERAGEIVCFKRERDRQIQRQTQRQGNTKR